VPVHAVALFERLQLACERGECELERADDGDLRSADLPDLGGVDVEVDHLRTRRERETLPVTRSSKRVPIAMIRSHLFSAQFAYFRAVHAGCAVVERVGVGQAALPHQRHDGGQATRFD